MSAAGVHFFLRADLKSSLAPWLRIIFWCGFYVIFRQKISATLRQHVYPIGCQISASSSVKQTCKVLSTLKQLCRYRSSNMEVFFYCGITIVCADFYDAEDKTGVQLKSDFERHGLSRGCHSF